MSMLRYGVGLALRRSGSAAAVSRLLGSGDTTFGVALRRSARLSHPPPYAASFRFKATGESSNARQLENRVEVTTGEFMNMNARMHCKGSSAPDAAKVHCKDLGGGLHAAKVHCKDHGAEVKVESIQGGMGSATDKRVSDECRRRTKQTLKKATGRGGGGRKKYRNHKDFLDRVVAPVTFCYLLLHIMITSH